MLNPPVIIYHKSDQYLFCFALIADPNTLFRSNSLSSKAMEQFMKVRICCFILSGISLYMIWLLISTLLVNLYYILPEH